MSSKKAGVRRRRPHSAELKARVALEAIQERRTLNEIASEHGVHPTQVSAWKRQALESLSAFFDGGLHGDRPELKCQESELFEQMGQLKMELEWLKKKIRGFALEPRRQLIGPDAKLSLSRQCELLGVGRSSWYYQPRGESAENLALMRALDELYTRWPFYGVRRMTIALQAQGWAVNPKRTRRLMRLMGLEAIYPKPRLSGNGSGHPRFPYLLKGLAIERSNQVWCSDITYTGLTGGFVYRSALMDWLSHFVLARELSNSLESDFCVRALPRALRTYGAPQISNTDQGVQFTSAGWIGLLTDQKIAISRDGRGRVFDNIFVEQLWRSL